MSPEKQRIAIAEICGWTDISSGPNYPAHGRLYDHRLLPIPNYPASLDAMHEAARTLKDRELRNSYINHLDQIIFPLLENEDDDVEREFLWCEATAAQRAEAFLKTHNRWEDGE